jgi:hypothetical protein
MRIALRHVLLTLSCLACREAPEPPSTLAVRVTNEGTAARLVVLDGDREIGRSGADGVLTVPVTPGSRHELGLRCPEGYSAETRSIVTGRPGHVSDVALECHAVSKVAIVAVSTRVAGLPVRVDEVEAARTDEWGNALVRVTRPAGEAFSVTVDASAGLEPPQSTRIFRLGERDELFVHQSEFRGRTRPRVARAAPLKTEAPYRLR